MILKIIGTQSPGERGMCCLMQAGEQRIVIDPGVTLGYMRHGLLPHPAQVAVGVAVRQVIIESLATATDIVFSHFHGNDVPLREATPYQLSLKQMVVVVPLQEIHCWCASWKDQSMKMQQRALDLAVFLGKRMKIAEGCSSGTLSLSLC